MVFAGETREDNKHLSSRPMLNLLSKVPVGGALYKVGDVAAAYKVLSEEICNEVLLDIKDRPHNRSNKNAPSFLKVRPILSAPAD